MRDASLKAEIWVKAQIRLCDLAFIPAVVVRRGDPDAGAVILRLNRLAGGVDVYTQVRDADGERAWMRGTGETPVDDSTADAYIDEQIRFDPDLWVLEIEDPEGRYRLDRTVI